MSEQPSRPTRSDVEAADWFTRLGRKSVTTQQLRDFRAWREDPTNDAAYRRVEGFWDASGSHADDPKLQRLTGEALTRRSRRGASRLAHRAGPWLWALPAGFVAAAIAAGAFGIRSLPPTYATDRGEQRIVLLQDGSRMHLNVASRARVRFSRGERRVELARGEAYFEVAHDAARPFVVIADGASVRAIGTKFDVRREEADVRVTLVEGRVRVDDHRAGAGWMLAPNQTLTVASGQIPRPSVTDASRDIGWTSGHLIFSQTPLSQAIAEVNRYGKRPIALQDSALAQRQLNGVFDIGDTDGFVKGVSELFDLTATPGPDGTIQLSAKGASPPA